jgi:hypothetical protein
MGLFATFLTGPRINAGFLTSSLGYSLTAEEKNMYSSKK